MNIQHLKYAVEIENAKSISKAAEKLYMGQPNLSRAIKELEQSLGIVIFKRTTKGIEPTPEGDEFLGFARGIIAQIDQVENYFSQDKEKVQKFSISVPRASYISNAFTNFTKKLDLEHSIEINYKETNNMMAVSNIVDEGYNLGILRYIKSYKKYFDIFLEQRELKGDVVCNFKYLVVMSKNHPLANCELSAEDLADYIEILHGDPFIPSLSILDVKKLETSQKINKHIYVYERGSQFDLLGEVPTTFMRVSPIPQRSLDRYGLIQKECAGFDKIYEDVLIYNKNHTFNNIEKMFIDELKQSVQNIIK